VHGFAAPIGGLFPAPHGAVCAALLPHVLRANLAALRSRAVTHPALARFDEVAKLLTGDAAAGGEDAIAFCETLSRTLAIPPLAAWGIHHEHVEEIAQKAAVASSMKANPIPLTHPQLVAVLTAALI
jgi:alcohol dehydrogenase class IV